MVYFQLAVYFLVFIWIQDSLAERFSIWFYPDTVLPGEEYTITCHSIYHTFWFKRNNDWTVMVSFGECNIPPSKAEDYKCVSNKVREDFIVKLKVLGGESSPQTVQWSCVHPAYITSSRILNMTIRNPDPPTTTQQKPKDKSSTPSSRQSSLQTIPVGAPLTTTPSSRQSSLQTIPVGAPLTTSSSPSSNDPRSANTPPSSRAPPNQPPVSSNQIVCKQGSFNIILIAICVVGVLVLINIVLVLYNKRKQDHTKQGPSRPLALEPRGIPGEGNYDNLDRTMDDGHTYDTAQAQGVPENSNLNSNGDEIPA